MRSPPVLFSFGLHLHQPVGNFDSVFAEHLESVYRPILTSLRDGGAMPLTLHISGPLLEWLERHDESGWLDLVGNLAAAKRVELMASGLDEPILAALPREDRVEQIIAMREALLSRFGVDARGLWLTERVWEPDLPADLVRAGIGYVVVDDRHFLAAGLERDALHLPWRTEADGAGLSVLPIDERLRYLIPFRPPSEFADYIRDLRSRGLRLALLADDGEKFGGWPGTREWVYERGWLARFLETLRALVDDGELRLVTCAEALAELPSAGLVYLPSASYREMEGWALPAPAALRLTALEHELGARIEGPEGGLVRGTHWRGFLAKYAESNRMHKKMARLSGLARARGNPAGARRAIGRAQCNDAYWHGVFGGLYLPFLRAAIWKELASAERDLRTGEALVASFADLDLDGHDEVDIHSASLAAVVSPHRGGGVEEFTWFASGVNLADTLTRRREAYHVVPAPGEELPAADSGGMASIHDLEKQITLQSLPPVDDAVRAMFHERTYAIEPDSEGMQAMSVEVSRSWVAQQFAARVDAATDVVEVVLESIGLTKRYRFRGEGQLEARFEWTADAGAWFTTELSLAAPVRLDTDAAREWRYPIETVAKSESGLQRTVQGEAVVLGWPVGTGKGWVTLTIVD